MEASNVNVLLAHVAAENAHCLDETLATLHSGQHHAECGHEHAPPYRFAATKYSEFMY